jgi:molybdenum cofactor synthesis domain-containing protein
MIAWKDSMKMFRRLMSLDEAQKTILQHFSPKPLGFDEVGLLEAYNRVLAEDAVATLDIPPFNRSTVDGYAVRAEDTFGAEENSPVELEICGIVNVGEPSKVSVKRGSAAEIVTGAPIPAGADAVVMLEYTERKAGSLHVYSAVVKDENIMKVGSDIKRGEPVLKAGQVLGSKEIGVLAAIGLAKVKIYAIPRVAILSTGAEVTEPGRRLQAGKVYDINAYSLSTAVAESGGKPIYMGVFPDDAAEIEKVIKKALVLADLVVASGGVSVGPKDLMPKVLGSLGKPGVIVCGIAIKPGKPATVASVDGKLVFSLPGHPASALLTFQLLARPIIQGMAGRRTGKPLEVKAFAGMRMFPAKGRRTFVMVKLKHDKSNRLVAEPVATGQSGAITTLAKADGFVEIAENQQFVDEGEEVTVKLFENYTM